MHYESKQESQDERRQENNNQYTDSIPTFLSKTFEILEVHKSHNNTQLPTFSHLIIWHEQQNPAYNDIISWTKNGEGFVVKRVKQFSDKILPLHFRHSNYSSFVRQLNMYDFHKMRQDNQENAFKNTLFKRGCRHLLREIQRKDYKKNKEMRIQIHTSHTINNKSDKQPESTIRKELTLEGEASSKFYSKTLNTCHNAIASLQSQLVDVEQLEELLIKYNSYKNNVNYRGVKYELIELLFKLKRSNALVEGCVDDFCNDWSSFLPKKFIKLDSLLQERNQNSNNLQAEDTEKEPEFRSLSFPTWAQSLVSFSSNPMINHHG